MKVSVIIPTFNRAHTLPRALESVMAQTERDIEVIVVDDRSTDDTKELVKRYKGVKYVLNKHVQGPAGARNQGLEKASGEYIAFLDSDDTWYSWHLEESLSCLEGFGLDACYALWYRQRGPIWERYSQKWLNILKQDLSLNQVGSVIPLGNKIAEYSIVKPFWCFHTDTLVVKKRALFGCGAFNETFFSAEDVELSFRILLSIPTGLINKYHARYYEGDDNLVALRENDLKKKKQHSKYMVKAFKKILTIVRASSLIVNKDLCKKQLYEKIEYYRGNNKIVLVTERILAPTKEGNFGGNIVRIMQLIDDLRSYGYKITLVTQASEENLTSVSLKNRVDELILVPLLVSGIGEHPGGGVLFNASNFFEALKNIDDAAAIIVEYLWMAPCLDMIGGNPIKIIDTLDVMHRRQKMCRQTNPWITCSIKEESKLLRKSDVVIAIQPEESKIFRKMLPGHKVITVLHRHEIHKPSKVTKNVVMLVGCYNWDNIYSLNQFLNGWRSVLCFIPSAKLKVYGRLAEAVPDGFPGVKKIGYQKDLTKAYQEASVVVNPAVLGTGLKIKTVEALCHGKALVTTRRGASGLDAGGLFVTNNIAEGLIRVLGDKALRMKLEWAAYKYAKEKFDKTSVYLELIGALGNKNRIHS